MGFSCGIVGLPNVGKSTLFNAMTATAAAQVGNFPFCTVDPNIGRVGVPDERLHILARMAHSAKIIPTSMDFVDIAGLVRGAAQGEGLGNRFLAHIREVDAIIHLLRCFEGNDITHVDDRVDPLSDMATIDTELMLADLESIERRQTNLRKRLKAGEAGAQELERALAWAHETLVEGKPLRSLLPATPAHDERWQVLSTQGFITSKPVIYVCNVGEHDLDGNALTQRVVDAMRKEQALVITVCAEIEAQLSILDDATRAEMQAAYKVTGTGLDRIVQAGYQTLGLQTFFTIGPKEARAWTITRGTKAPQAAGKIHADFERGFICAEIVGYQDYLNVGSDVVARERGLLRQEGRQYAMQDGDVVHFRFNV